MSAKTSVPYGEWASPVSVALMTEAAVGLGGLAADAGYLYWLEARPREAGRTSLCRRDPNGEIEDVTPPPINVGSRVHEYGGGAYAACEGTIIFSERSDGSVWLVEGKSLPHRIETPSGCRYADFAFDLPRRRVLAVREDHRDRPPTDPKAAIVALPLDATGTEQVLIEGPDFLSSPRLSPGGKLCWIAWDHPNMPWEGTRLYIASLNATGGGIEGTRLVAGQVPEAIVQPGWSRDGALYFCSDRSGWWNIYALREGVVTPVAPVDAEIGGPHWLFRQRFYDFLPDGRIVAAMVLDGIRTAVVITGGQIKPLEIGQVQECPCSCGEALAFIATPPAAPPSVSIIPRLGEPSSIIRSAAPAVIPDETISLGQPITFPTRGAMAHGFWYPPKNRDYDGPQGELPPLVVLSHGGPTSMATNSFSLSIQWWTSRGFGVVDVNYGGSTGYGRAYRERLNGQWGAVDVEDCAAAASHLVERGFVDPSRLIIRGGSAGGFTTLAALTSRDLFSAGASFYGVADLLLLARDTHKFESRYLDRLIGPLPEAEALYRERSPINHVDRLNCPVIFFQGEDDKTVPPNQAETMVSAMTSRGLPVAYYSFAGEGHGFRKAETLRRTLELELDFYGRVFGFSPPGLGEHAHILNMADPRRVGT
ncbi:MAG TPA: S9 family peptidase [Methylocella sp.]|nr:S9 family peptidase [Methylocella sp.]